MTYQQLWQSLCPLYDAGEARAIVRTLLEERFGLTMTDILCGGISRLDQSHVADLELMMQRLRKAEPIQYVLGEAPFMQRKMYVEPGVLIPRPETEKLCQWILSDDHPAQAQVLDVGCGSGCIAVTLALDLNHAHVTAIDLSENALAITRRNAAAHQASVEVVRRDALALTGDGGRWHIIVSNPPYICRREASQMHPNVTRHEPPLALFVPDDDPLLFFRSIGSYALTALQPDGALYFECNTALADATARLLRQQGFKDVETRSDQFGKPRFTKAVRP